MGLLKKLLIAAGTAVGIGLTAKAVEKHKENKEKKEKAKQLEDKRKSTKVIFNQPMTRDFFEELAVSVAKPIKRLKVKIDEQFVYGYVSTTSGINTWEFCLDYNDYGKITGNYWIRYYGNYESEIPEKYAEKLKAAIQEELENYNKVKDELTMEILCPYCGADLTKQEDFDKDSEFYECKECDAMWHNGDWHCQKCNSNLSKQDGFGSMDWDYFKCRECGEIFFNAEFTCPYCDAILNDQKGFNPEYKFHKCTVCGRDIFSDEDKVYSGEKFEDTYWYCDRCESLLSVQKGFTDTCGKWKCEKCGYENVISFENIKEDPEIIKSVKREETLRDNSTIGELNSLIGLESVKQQIKRLRAVLIKNKSYKDKINLHMCFYGNPGTGKTTVARLVAKILYEEGILPTDNLVETDRSGLVGVYLGQTAPKTHEKVQEAMGGVLFIDEAYSLCNSKNFDDEYGKEAIAALLKDMEDYKGKLCVILAGYKEPMEEMIATNPGFDSRINRKINFEDYTIDEMEQIFNLMLVEKGYKVTSDAMASIKEIFELHSNKKDFANARTVRNVLDTLIEIQSVRVLDDSDETNDNESVIKMEDVEQYRIEMKN